MGGRKPTTVAERKAREGSGKRGGIPKFVPTPEQRTMVQLYSAFGMLHDDIRLHIKKDDGNPISLKTLQRAFPVEIESGLSKANSIVAGKLFEQAKNGNTTAMIFWLKCRAKWKETEVVEHTGKDGAALNTVFSVEIVKPAE